MDEMPQFRNSFRALTSEEPFPWQEALFVNWFSQGKFPASCNLPTGLGKTSVVAIWLIALALHPSKMPRRLVYVVNRRTVVDQTTVEVEKLRANLGRAGLVEGLARLCAIPLRPDDSPLALSTLRGQFADNREWSADPARPAVIVGTVDMIGSRLLFSGYGIGFKLRPLHAAFLGQDVLLVHDESHLEPAFQTLIEAIRAEQAKEPAALGEKLRMNIMALSATSRTGGQVFGLTEQEKSGMVEAVRKRIEAPKSLKLQPAKDEKKLAEQIAELALQFEGSNSAVLIFLRKLEDVQKVVKQLPGKRTQQLTGTMRGFERDRMTDPRRSSGCPIFARFLKPPKPDAGENERWKVEPLPGTVYLICTSAGEVGVNLSANHLVCDLSTFDSMTQRFGRVNRFGDRTDTKIHVVHPKEFAQDHPVEDRRSKTLMLLQQLNGDGSPKAIDQLRAKDRLDAFAPEPIILPTSDILFDGWSLTTISPPLVRAALPGQPPAEPYLHGVSEWQPPETNIAWREEVELIAGELLQNYSPEDLLEDYPLKPHEVLRDSTDRKGSGVFAQLQKIAESFPMSSAWILDSHGRVQVATLKDLVTRGSESLYHTTVLLPPRVGGLTASGTLDGTERHDTALLYDVADMWGVESEDVSVKRRIRLWNNDPQLNVLRGMRLIRAPLDTRPNIDEDESESVRRFWLWYARPRSADDDLSKTSTEPIRWKDHTDDVVKNIERIVQALNLPPAFRQAFRLAAKFHDFGKKRDPWQRSIGNLNSGDCYAKSGRDPVTGRLWKPIDSCPDYRHEFGSLLDIEDDAELTILPHQMQDLVLHVIAAHHGRARPHFPLEEAYDPTRTDAQANKLAAEVPRRFARLQGMYGRWGLAYLESLLRAADRAASANPSVNP